MQYQTLGRTGLKVSELCLGTMQWGWTATEEQAQWVMDAFVEAGGGEDGYALELFNGLGRTVKVIVVAESAIMALTADHVWAVRRLGAISSG